MCCRADSAYWPLRPAGAAVAVSIALQDADESNGCFRIIPRFASSPGSPHPQVCNESTIIPRSHTWGLKHWGAITRAPGEDIMTPQAADEAAAERLQGIANDGDDAMDAPTAEMLATQVKVPLKAGDVR